MAENMKLHKIEIMPAENGGHTVTHHYKQSPTYSSGKGMGVSYKDPTQHVFGASEGHAMLAHCANALCIPEKGE